MLASKRRLQRQYETTEQERRELLSVLTAQKRYHPDGLSPWEAYVTQAKVSSSDGKQEGMMRSIPIKGYATR